MRYRISLLLLAGLFGWLPVQAQTAPASDTQLLQALESSLKAKDKPTIMALYNWDGVSDWAKADRSDDIDDWLTRDLKSANLSPLPPGFRAGGEYGNIRFHFNVQPVGVMELHFTDGSGIGFPYGKKDGAFYIAGVITEDIPVPPGDTNAVLIRIESPAGRPLVHVKVDSSSPENIPWLHFKRLLGADFLTDGQGQLHLPLTDTNQSLVVANGQGFGWLPGNQVANHAVMMLQPWAHIEGVLKNRNRAVTNLQVELTIDRNFYGGKETPPVRLAGETVTTDGQGRFAFDSVPPLKLVINRHDDQTPFGMYVCSLSVKPGETKHLEINLRGRTVTGRVILAPGLDTNLNLSDCSASLRSMVKTPEGAERDVYFQISTNGTFHADFVEPGNYKISGDLWGKSNMVAFLDPVEVHVPDDTSDAADVPFDMGTVTLKAALGPGIAAPDFSVSDLDGKSLRLSDYRGKYVLLDFWATWCGPCVGETPNLQATYEAFGKDQRFAMISLSLDQDPSAPRKFVRDHNIPWTQGFLGDWSSDKVTATYGIHAIPAIYLIGPDGKVVAANLRGGGIKEAVAAALKD